MTLEVSPEQAEKINVATELGKLSLTLRSLNGTDGNIGVATAAPPSDAAIKPIWAGDVSPALGDALSSNKVIAAEQPAVEVIRGAKSAKVKHQ